MKRWCLQRAAEVASGAKEAEPAKKALERVGKDMDGLGRQFFDQSGFGWLK